MPHLYKPYASAMESRSRPNLLDAREDEQRRRDMDTAFQRHFAECQVRYGTPVSKPVPPKLVLKG